MNGYHQYQNCIEACLRCAAVCNHCASAWLQEADVKKMAHCIQLDMECAAVCYAAAQVMSLGGQTARELCRLCAQICNACANECHQHQMEHCQECASACRSCAEACQKMAA